MRPSEHGVRTFQLVFLHPVSARRPFWLAALAALALGTAAQAAAPNVLVLPFVGDSSEALSKQARNVLRRGGKVQVLEVPRGVAALTRARTLNPAAIGRLSARVPFDLAVACERRAALRCSIVRPDGALAQVLMVPLFKGWASGGGLHALEEALLELNAGPPPAGEPVTRQLPELTLPPPELTPDGGVARAPPPAPDAGVALPVPPPALGPGPSSSATVPSPRAFRVRGGGVEVDGVLDDEVWASVPAFTRFQTTYPEVGPPAQETELRVAFDDDNLYIAVLCRDTEPSKVLRPLGRRDNPPPSDTVTVMIDTARERRSAYYFAVNAAGVQEDGLLSSEEDMTSNWDAVWEAKTQAREDGWSAEMRIPLGALRLTPDEPQRWGFNLRRRVGRTGQLLDSSPLARRANQFLTQFSELLGVDAEPARGIQITPFLAARAFLHPRSLDPLSSSPRLLDPSADIGVDAKAALSSSVVLTATLNPDFGELEADEVILNFGNVEIFRPEKRAFFNEGADVFLPANGSGGQSGQMLFYSRRVGLDAPIFAAAKLYGTVGRTQVGVLDAVVMGPADPTKIAALEAPAPLNEVEPDRRLQLHPSRPFHLGLNDELPPARPIPRNFLAAVVRQQIREGFSLGTLYAGSQPLSGECDAAQELAGLTVCPPEGSHALGMDFQVLSAAGEWGVIGQLEASMITGGPPTGRVLADGTRLLPGGLGTGTHVRAGKLGGEHLQAFVEYQYAAPTLELNQVGYLAVQNQQTPALTLRYTQPFGGLEDFSVSLDALGTWSTEGKRTLLELSGGAAISAITARHHALLLYVGVQAARKDLRELANTGIPLQRPDLLTVNASFSSDAARPFSFTAQLQAVRSVGVRPQLRLGGYYAVAWRPLPQLELSHSLDLSQPTDSPYLVDAPEPGKFVLADLDSLILSAELRASFAFTPTLSFQLSAQGLTSYNVYGPFYAASSGGTPITFDSLTPYEGDPPSDPSFQLGSLRLTAVLRWEYQLGSTLLLVYSRSQESAPGGEIRRSLLPQSWQGPTTDGLMLKWSHTFGL